MGERRFLIAAGGTGGHIIPGILIGRELARQAPGLTVRHLCGNRPIEARIYQAEGIEPVILPVGSVSGRRIPGIYTLRLGVEFVRLLGSFLADRPAGILAMGGAVCFPVLAAGALLGIPLHLHESNRIPGRVVRLFRRFARTVFIGMDGLDGTNVVRAGTPSKSIRLDLMERDAVVCVGGSQGAASLNAAFIEAANSVRLSGRKERFILVCGPGKLPDGAGRVECREYEPDMPSLMARALVVVSRSGSGALGDIANAGVASVLVPYPHAMDNHQLANARFFAERGAAIVLEEKGLDTESLAQTLQELLENDHLRGQFARNAGMLACPESAREIAARILAAPTAVRTPHPTRQVPHESS